VTYHCKQRGYAELYSQLAPTHSQPDPRRRWVVITTLRPLGPQENLCNLCTGGWMGLGVSLYGTENLASTGIRSMDRPV